MEVRAFVICAALVASSPSGAQQLKTATGSQPPPRYEPKRAQPYNPGATPLDCQQHVDPRIRLFCSDIERSIVQGSAKRQGLPVPSSEVVKLPAMGTGDAKELGAACVGGTAMRRLSNGWEQLRNAQGHWIRCREG